MGQPFMYGMTHGCHPISFPFVPLINTASNRWDSTILRSIFLPRDVELIESIPLSSI